MAFPKKPAGRSSSARPAGGRSAGGKPFSRGPAARGGSRPAQEEMRGIPFDNKLRPKLDRDNEEFNEDWSTAAEGDGERGSREDRPDKIDKNEVKVAGVHACHAVFKQRPTSIIRAYVTDERMKEFSQLLSWCAKERKAYHVVIQEDLDKIAGTVHHEGVCLLTKRPPMPDALELVKELVKQKGAQCIVVLEAIHNPHTLGAFMRVASNFGATAILAGGLASKGLTAAAYRTAEGGAEFIPLALMTSLKDVVLALRAGGFSVIATSGRGEVDIYQGELPRRCAILFGAEREGLTAAAMKNSDKVLKIPGTGAVESLNLSCAGSVVLGEWRRQFPIGKKV